MSENRLRIAPRLPKRDPGYWRERLFKNAFRYNGRRSEVRSWSVKIQLFGRRKSFTLKASDRAQAAAEACRIYGILTERAWDAVAAERAAARPESNGVSSRVVSQTSMQQDREYWRRRLIHRKYPETSQPEREREFSVRIEHAGTGHYFPLGTSDENEAAARAMGIYRTVVNQGWSTANAQFPRELSLAFRWQDNPLAWTYTTIHTSPMGGQPVATQAGRLPAKSVVLVEPDYGIGSALAGCVNGEEGFRCEAAFGSAAEATRGIAGRRPDLALTNHDVPTKPGMAWLEELQRAWPSLAVLSYSAFEDTDQLFKSTPGGAIGYMLRRTAPCSIFEPIANLTGSATREQIASYVRQYFQQLSALLPAGPPCWKLAKLTPREHQILAFLSKGDLVKEIAHRLGISNWTVHGHVKSLFEKLKVHTRTEAVIKYLQK